MIKRKKNQRKSCGFTMIELLVTTSVVGILAALGMANFEEFRGNASDIQAMSIAKNGLTSFNAYMVDHQNLEEITVHLGAVHSPNGNITLRGVNSISELLPGLPEIPKGIKFEAMLSPKDSLPMLGGLPIRAYTMHVYAMHCENGRKYQQGNSVYLNAFYNGFSIKRRDSNGSYSGQTRALNLYCS